MNYSELRSSLSKRLMVLFPEFMSKRRYKSGIGRPMDINNPKAMTEKLMYLKLRKYWNNPLVASLEDAAKVEIIFYSAKECGVFLFFACVLGGFWGAIPRCLRRYGVLECCGSGPRTRLF